MQSFEIENVLIQIHSHIHHMRNCVKSFDCDNKAYNFLALLTQLKGVKRSKEREWEREGDHIEGVHGIFTYATSKGNKRVGEGEAANTMQTIERLALAYRLTTKFAGCQLQASPSPKKKKKEDIYIHTYVVLWVVSWYIYMSLNMHYATQPDGGWQQFNIAWQSIFATSAKGSHCLAWESRREAPLCRRAFKKKKKQKKE